jgi:hypothetical protein
VPRPAFVIAATLSAAVAAGCGGGGGHKSAKAPAKPPPPTTVAQSGHPAFRAALTTGTDRPRTGVPWAYSVRAVDARGRPIPATAIVRVLEGDNVRDTVGWFGFRGTLRRSYKWSSELEGQTAILEVKVVGQGGTQVIRHAVTVKAG